MSESLWSDEQSKPIQHLRVIDVTVMLTGPYLTRILAQYGAEVIKVEKLPDGDPLRQPQFHSIFELLNQGKKSLALDLNHQSAIEIVRQLAAEADVFIENFKDGVMDSLGLGYSHLSELNPDLLYFSLRGLHGQLSGKASHDLNFIATSGVGEWFLEEHPNYSTQFGDIVGGVMNPLIKLMMHISNPDRRGMHLITHMDEGFRSLYLPRAFETVQAESATPENRKNHESWRLFNGSEPHSRYYRCRDNQWISLQAVQVKHWEFLCEVVDRKEWKTRQRDSSLISDMEKLFLDAPASYWEALSASGDACLFRVIPWSEALSFSQLRAQLNHDPLTWAGFAPNPSLTASPALGSDSFSLAHSAGVDNTTLSKLIHDGILLQKK